MIKHLANILTGFRILGSILLLFFPVFSEAFYILYLLCGLSDMTDGTIARMTNSENEFGKKLDTVADFVFVSVSLMTILPTISIPGWLWFWGVIIGIIKIGNIFRGYVLKKQLICPHTIMNKITGLLLFLLPFTLPLIQLKYSSILVCSIATFAAIQEGILTL